MLSSTRRKRRETQLKDQFQGKWLLVYKPVPHCGRHFQFLSKNMSHFFPSKSVKIQCLKPLPKILFAHFQPIIDFYWNLNHISSILNEKRPYNFWTKFENDGHSALLSFETWQFNRIKRGIWELVLPLTQRTGLISEKWIIFLTFSLTGIWIFTPEQPANKGLDNH